ITGHIPKRILNLDDTSIPIDWYAGMAYLTKGKQADAMHNFKRAIKTHLNQHNAWNNMGVLYFEQNQLDSAITCFSHAKKIAPYRWAYTKNLASAYAATGQYREALNLLDDWPDDQEEKEDLRQKIMGYLNGEITH
ncbi:MAG: tetratricopeptide repeat protein, partial [Saprospiraceae bacterium]|nr:tetratricopeptide repeat protein [Saprospiraceae bacterium]